MASIPREKKEARNKKHILWFKDIGIADISLVGGKNASLGEMYRQLSADGVMVPNGFAVTAYAYREFLRSSGLQKKIKELVKDLDVRNVKELKNTGKKIRSAILASCMPVAIETAVLEAYKEISEEAGRTQLSVAVRSSATAEDLPDASFAGQQETYLNVKGNKDVLAAVKKCMASLYTDRAISYRDSHGFDQTSVALSVTIQQMVDASHGASGVMFTMDTESGFTGVTLVNASYGLGEYVVQGRVVPDQYYIFKEGLRAGKDAIISRNLGSKEVKLVYGTSKGTEQVKVPKKERNQFAISDKDVLTLAGWADRIEAHYKKPQDIEWVKDGKTGKLYIVQARPETVNTRSDKTIIRSYRLKKEGSVLLKGIAVGQRIGAGKVRIVESPKHMRDFNEGDVLVTHITDPDWEPIMRKAAAIVTEQGGKTSHAAIVSRELGVPCIVGAAGARSVLKKGQKVTVSCTGGDVGVVYGGMLPFEIKETQIKEIPKTKTKIMMNVGDPEHAFSLSFLPHDGVGLARLEFIFSNFIRIHPLALLQYKTLKDKHARKKIQEMTRGYEKKQDYCVDKLAQGIARIAAASYPKPVIVRTSDFKTNEYATLIGGQQFEPKEENPMLGWRGASRYYSKEYKEAFGLECKAIQRVRETWGLDNVIIMIPFCRTPEEGEKVLSVMKEFGLERGKHGLEVYVMCEIPSNVILAEEFAALFDGFSIGSNDLVQLTLGIDRDTTNMAGIGDPNNEAVKRLIRDVIRVAHKEKKKVGICGQAPSDYPEFAEFLVKEGIDSISLNPDTVVETRTRIAYVEKTVGRTGSKTHKTYASMVAGFGLLAAGLLSLGVGCAGISSAPPAGLADSSYIAPSRIREEAYGKMQEALATQKADYEQEMTELVEKDFANFRVSYPAQWNVKHWNGGVTMENTETQEYVSMYKELVTPPISIETYESILVNGLPGVRLDMPLMTTATSSLVRLTIDESTTLVLEGVSPRFNDILASFSLLSVDEQTLDRAITHWDVRERRICERMLTFAKEGPTGECRAYTSPCDIPDDWTVCDAGDT